VAGLRPAALGIGVRGSVNFIPESLVTFYGESRPTGGAVFLRLGFVRNATGPAGHAEHAEHAEHAP